MKLQGCSFDLRMCQRHKLDIKLYSVISKFRHNNIRLHFLGISKVVSHPTDAKTTVSETFRSNGLFKLPSPNACQKDSIKHFLVPLLTYGVCTQYSIIYSGMSEMW